jgi:integrating conjugative element membrane protein (TIGR03747 family)
MYAEAKRAGRENDFFMFHLGFPDISARYNPVGSFSKVTEVATRTANPLPDEGQSSAFRQFAWRFVNVIARTMVALGEKPSFESIYRFAVNADSLCERYFEYWLDRDCPNWRNEFDEGRQREKDKAIEPSAKKTGRALRTLTLLSYIRDLELRDSVGDSLMSILSNEKSYFEKLVSSLYPLLEKLTTGKMAELISPSYFDLDDKRPISVNTANVVYSAVYGSSGITEMGDRFQRGEYLSESDVRAGRLYAEYYPWLKASMISSQLLGLRLGMLVCVLPALLLFYFIAFSDGIVERAIRRDCGGRESASIYHRAKYLQLTVLCIFTLLYLAWPTPTIYPGAPIAFSVLIGLLARIQWKYYKKYL